ncbi:AraC family transcriptional regulator [Bradyrhizobium sp. USDA 4369]
MESKRNLESDETHGVLRQFDADVVVSSRGLGWSSAHASIQRERPFEGRLDAISDCMLVVHRSGPVDVTYRADGWSLTRRVPSGGISLLPAGYQCDIALHAPLETMHVYLRSDLFVDEGRMVVPAPWIGAQDSILHHLASALGEGLRDSRGASSLFVEPIAHAIARRVVSIDGKCTTDGDRRSRLSERQMRQVREFVEANLDDDIRLEAMASACGLGAKAFLRLFKASVGTSPYQYVIAVRVERAKALLDEQSLGLAEIALRCGFSHQEHLTRMFRRLVGQTPGRYRRRAD